VFFGKAGFLSQADRSLAPSAAAARAGYDSVLAHLVAFNAQRGWCIDTFFHTWDAPLEAELVALLRPAAHGVAGERGLLAGYGLPASMENALAVMRRFVAARRGGAPYRRIVALRFDSELMHDFDLEKLRDDAALYVASWCKATGAETLRDGARVCRELAHNPNDAFSPAANASGGLPDFYFAGSPPALASDSTSVQGREGVAPPAGTGTARKGMARSA
jgi:hypothetical protein